MWQKLRQIAYNIVICKAHKSAVMLNRRRWLWVCYKNVTVHCYALLR